MRTGRLPSGYRHLAATAHMAAPYNALDSSPPPSKKRIGRCSFFKQHISFFPKSRCYRHGNACLRRLYLYLGRIWRRHPLLFLEPPSAAQRLHPGLKSFFFLLLVPADKQPPHPWLQQLPEPLAALKLPVLVRCQRMMSLDCADLHQRYLPCLPSHPKDKSHQRESPYSPKKLSIPRFLL
jgi:hypothetical protein